RVGRREHELHVAFDVRLDGPAVDADGVVEVAALEDVLMGQRVLAANAARFADAELRCDLDDVGVVESRSDALDELKDVPALPTALDLAVRELPGVDAVDRCAVGILDLRHVRAPFNRVALRPEHRLLAGEAAAGGFGLVHQPRNELPRATGLIGIDAVD